MNQRLLTLLNRPMPANLHLRDLLLFLVAAVLTYSIFAYAPAMTLLQDSAKAPSNKAFVGVINGQGKWIIPPRYLQIIYMPKTDNFWVKVRESDVSNPWMPDSLDWAGRNTAWKLLDRKGHELLSYLPYLSEPVCAEMTDFGASIHPDKLVVKKNCEYGYCEPDGRPITGCKYSFICDVGHGKWLASETKKDLSEQQMPIVMLDHNGKKLRTLDLDINYRYYAGNGVLECFRRGQSGYVDYRGEFIPLAVNENSPGRMSVVATCEQPVKCKSLDHSSKSSSKPGNWIELRKSLEKYDDVFQKPFVDNRAVMGGGGHSGLVDINGNWLLEPTFNGLLYCNEDTLIAHKKQRTADEIQLERYEHCRSLTGF